MLRVGLVSDNAIAAQAFHRFLSEHTAHPVAWMSRTASQAIQLCRQDRPDLIFIDLTLPDMDAVEATRRIVHEFSTGIVIAPSTVSPASRDATLRQVFEALEAGAVDALPKPILVGTTVQDLSFLVERIDHYCHLLKPNRHPVRRTGRMLLAVGGSAGVPATVKRLLNSLPLRFPAAMVVLQPIHPVFRRGLIEWLDARTDCSITPLEEAVHPVSGGIYVATRPEHLVVNPDGQLDYLRESALSRHSPSLDVFFESMAKHWKGPGAGVTVMGVGHDGLLGLLLLRQQGFQAFVQRETQVEDSQSVGGQAGILSVTPDELPNEILKWAQTVR